MARKIGSHSSITGPLVRAAAQKLFSRHGYAAVSMRQIAAEVGVQAGALYLYTPDKQTLLFELMRKHMEHLLSTWEEAEKPDSAVPLLETFCRFHISYHLERPDQVFIAYMELRNLEPDNFSQIQALRREYEDQLQSILETGHGRSEFNLVDRRLATMAIIAMLTGVNTWYRESGRLSATAVGDIYWNMVKKAVAA